MLLDARLTRLFCVVAEELHFGRAAKRLFMSQPPLSQAIRQLEEMMQAELFVRTTRSVKLTKAGQYLFDHLQRLENDTLHLKESVQQIARGKRGVVRIGVTPSGIYSRFSSVLRYFRTQHPDIVLHVAESSTEAMNDTLRRGQLDIAFMRPLIPLPELRHEVVYREPLCLAVHDGHPLSGRPLVHRRDLQAMPLITYDPIRSPYFHHLSARWLGDMHIAIHAVQESVLPTTLALVSGGLGAAIVPSAFSLFRTFGLSYLPLKDAWRHPAELSLVWRSDEADPLILAVVDLLLRQRAIFEPSPEQAGGQAEDAGRAVGASTGGGQAE